MTQENIHLEEESDSSSSETTMRTSLTNCTSHLIQDGDLPQIEIPNESDQRFSVLSFEQVKRLSDLMRSVIPIHGRGNFPTIDVKLCDLVTKVRWKLETDYNIHVKDIRLNGSRASSVLVDELISYNDLDLIFSVDLPNNKAYDRVKMAVLDTLIELLPEGVSRKRMSSCSMKEARSKTVELKFVDSMKRQYEFSVDSFHILLDTLFLFYHKYNDFSDALTHLCKKLIATRNPEEIRGGGLLKYCSLLVRNYKPVRADEVKSMERYMCSRFFIDFPDISQQQAKLENYLWNHFASTEDPQIKYDYLIILYQVVNESTVCLMNHERRLTLSLIEDLAMSIYNNSQIDYSDNSDTCSTTSSSSNCSLKQLSIPHPPPTSSPSPTQLQPSTNGTTMIPTYEIVTSVQPTVYYSSNNGYYFVSSASPPLQSTGPCMTCSCNQWANTITVTNGQQQSSNPLIPTTLNCYTTFFLSF
ncbi:TENT5A_B [Lepeophtheirus salmonis]|uniref:polynucleotide adenylyltransferase n=1 Tax=Lepeophtheirus salmonis TaxID=72036 RepID=A0A7R8HCL7_LEPSM|nr:TENT5A_B [Lepeophtheirus salmonis]CAF3012324.1 TENT5A_B [Lepeophtheirus salmonis]